MTLAKDNGSTDNISIVVVFLRAIDELAERKKNTKETKEGDKDYVR